MDSDVKKRFFEAVIFMGSIFYLIVFQYFLNTHVLVPMLLGIALLLVFNYFTHSIVKNKIILYIVEFIGFSLYWYDYMGLIGFAVYALLTSLIYTSLNERI
ncbi:MAG: hypothetical protein ACRCWM_08310 [Sarcina sp.]